MQSMAEQPWNEWKMILKGFEFRLGYTNHKLTTLVALLRQAGGRKNATYCTHLFDTYYTINAGRMIG